MRHPSPPVRPHAVPKVERWIAAAALITVVAASCMFAGPSGPAVQTAGSDASRAPRGVALGSLAHEQAVMKSTYCAECHADIYAEHEQTTHGRAFTDEEVRLATGRFSQGDCIVCHTPRPIFETGIGQNPARRWFDLEEGNTCMTCHWQQGTDYSRFVGGADCKTGFDARVGTVEACASCHRNHGTPYQWEIAKNGKLAGRICTDCHMPLVSRPIAKGGAVREVRSHTFPGSRSATQLRKAYAWAAEVKGDEVVVRIENKGAGHNFPTELKQRSIESLVIVRDLDGVEIARSRMTFRDPYKRPYGLTLPVNTQIPSGEAREHHVPLTVAAGTVECELHYKLYYPIEDNHPELARRLESTRLTFGGITPSTKKVESEPEVAIVTPEGIAPETAGPANLVDYAHPPIGKVELEVPAGSTPADIDGLVALFQFPVPEANLQARKRLVAIGAPAVPALIAALGSWDNKTYNQSMAVLEQIGAPAHRAIVAALRSDQLYIRLKACELVGRLSLRGDGDAAVAELLASLQRPNALDRSHAAEALGALHVEPAAAALRKLLLADRDPDVVRSCARVLAMLGCKEAAADVHEALGRFDWPETRCDLAEVLAKLGDPRGVDVLLAGLDQRDDLVREGYFEALFRVTSKHFCYDPMAPRDERLEASARLAAWWAESGGANALQHPRKVPYRVRSEVRKIVEQIAGSDGTIPPGDDAQLRARLIELGVDAVPTIAALGLKYAAGFSDKRAVLCSVLGELGDPAAVPALISALRDPVVAVAAWACDALGRIGDESALPALQRYHQRLLSLAAQGRVPASAGTNDAVIALAAATCYRLGDRKLASDLTGFLLSADQGARTLAFQALREAYGRELDYDPNADAAARRAAVARWQARAR